MKKFTLLTLCILLSSTFLFSQSLWKHRSGPNYLPNDTVLSIDSKGDTLMLGTIDGLIIKTPQQQTLLTTADGLASNTIDKIEIADDGSYMIYHGDVSSISYFNGSSFQILTQGTDFDGPFLELESDADNVFYYLGGPLLDCYAYSNSSFQIIDSKPITSGSNSLARSENGSVFGHNDSTLIEYRNGNRIAGHVFQGIIQILESENGILVHSNNQDHKFHVYNSNGFTDIDPNDEFTYNGGKLLFFDGDSSVWVNENRMLDELGSDESMASLNLNAPVSPGQIVKWNGKFYIQRDYTGYLESYNDDVNLKKDKISSQNNMRFRLNPNGSLGFLRDANNDDRNQFKDHNLIYLANSWISAKIKNSNDFRIAADNTNGWNHLDSVYSQRLSSGPYSNDYEIFKNHQAWRVTQSQIVDHIANYSDPGYEIPLDIKNWPAHGAINRGQAKCIAPFVDVDNDGVYKPENGDYPQIRGDEAIYAVFNDEYARLSGEQPMHIEGHIMMYTYASSDPKLSNTVFLNYRVINRSVNNYEDFKFGYNIDADLGYPQDDFTGCDTTNNLFYFYNGDSFDEGFPGTEGFLSSTPAMGLVFLDNEITSFISYNNTNQVNGDPQSINHFKYYLDGMFKNGAPPMDLQGQPSSFMYSGDPVTNTGWTEENSGNQPFDRRGVGAISIPQFNSGDTVEIDMALTLAENDGTVDNFEVVGDLRSQVQDIQQWYNNQQFDPWEYDCNAYNSVPDRDLTENSSFKLYPNPAENRINVEFSEKLSKPALIEVYNAVGTLVRSEYRTGKRVQVQLSSLNSGYYLIRVKTESIVESKPLIVR
ncbi:MAG: T9SS type A sorting domain-containing protein [Salibacter sp.]|uniref:T9SS type A sorting domain-containing protein n=1 Tax=Salibacter sp. TaxID=2010995 RepID=UPI002870126E|nr:T9SS type A sorting domain-containing protein [Salibacter sp.]MDR9399708.1 T9SS type A sorting domain-containing protein [Salibacter sp.]